MALTSSESTTATSTSQTWFGCHAKGSDWADAVDREAGIIGGTSAAGVFYRYATGGSEYLVEWNLAEFFAQASAQPSSQPAWQAAGQAAGDASEPGSEPANAPPARHPDSAMPLSWLDALDELEDHAKTAYDAPEQLPALTDAAILHLTAMDDPANPGTPIVQTCATEGNEGAGAADGPSTEPLPPEFWEKYNACARRRSPPGPRISCITGKPVGYTNPEPGLGAVGQQGYGFWGWIQGILDAGGAAHKSTEPGRRPARTPDEKKLIEMCHGDPELIRKVEILFDILDKSGVWWGPNGCHRWADKFEKLYKELDAKDRLDIEHQYPFCDVWYMPLWLNHSVIAFTLDDKTVYLDKGFQGGSDHIAFEPRPDLIYMGDPRWQRWFDQYLGPKPPPRRPVGPGPYIGPFNPY